MSAGLFAPRNALVVAALLVGALALSGAAPEVRYFHTLPNAGVEQAFGEGLDECRLGL